MTSSCWSSMGALWRGAVSVGLLLLFGCTGVSEIRTHHRQGADLPSVNVENPSEGCDSSSTTLESRKYSIEDYGDYWAGYVEFDDEGWLYHSPESPNQLEAVQQRLKKELNNPVNADTDFLIIAFIHGWHHNANDQDCNVHEFRAMLKLANARYAEETRKKPGNRHKRRLVGIYAGWRGESVDLDYLNATTVIDRRNAAERVAKGDVRELFAQLRKLQIGEFNKMDQDQAAKHPERMRTVVIGHSFGGLIAFNGLSPAVLNELTLTKPEDGDQHCKPVVTRPSTTQNQSAKTPVKDETEVRKSLAIPVFPDKLILINPAFEATRFESLHNLMRPVNDCPYPADQPKVIVVTADNDWATGPLFTFGRRILTLLEAYPQGSDPRSLTRERDANVHAIGFVERYQTHRLCLKVRVPGEKPRAVAAWTPPKSPDWPMTDRYAPIWVVGAPKQIINGHNGFLFAAPEGMEHDKESKKEPYLLNWLIDLHLEGPQEDSIAMTKDGTC